MVNPPSCINQNPGPRLQITNEEVSGRAGGQEPGVFGSLEPEPLEKTRSRSR